MSRTLNQIITVFEPPVSRHTWDSGEVSTCMSLQCSVCTVSHWDHDYKYKSHVSICLQWLTIYGYGQRLLVDSTVEISNEEKAYCSHSLLGLVSHVVSEFAN